jgi:hypothetical protein
VKTYTNILPIIIITIVVTILVHNQVIPNLHIYTHKGKADHRCHSFPSLFTLNANIVSLCPLLTTTPYLTLLTLHIDGPVANLQAGLSNIDRNTGRVTNGVGESVAVVHQYDRKPDLQKKLFHRVCLSPSLCCHSLI